MLAPPSDSGSESEYEDDGACWHAGGWLSLRPCLGNDRKLANINPIVTVKQSLKLSLEELSRFTCPSHCG